MSKNYWSHELQPKRYVNYLPLIRYLNSLTPLFVEVKVHKSRPSSLNLKKNACFASNAGVNGPCSLDS